MEQHTKKLNTNNNNNNQKQNARRVNKESASERACVARKRRRYRGRRRRRRLFGARKITTMPDECAWFGGVCSKIGPTKGGGDRGRLGSNI